MLLGRELGQGGFGSVYHGRLRATGEDVAVKIPREALGNEDRERLEREVRLLQGIHHPRLARLLGACPNREGRLALVYEFVPGQPLYQLLEGRPIGNAILSAWVRDLAEGLEALHGAGLVHRDLKASNVISEPSGSLRLLDFGLTRPYCGAGETLTRTGVLLGTPGAMAPEQLRGAPSGPRTDVYALGCLAFEFLTGQPPFLGDVPTLMRAHLEELPPRLEGFRPDLPPETQQVLDRALAKDPGERPSRAPELAAALSASLEALRTSSPASSQAVTRSLGPGPGSNRARALPPARTPRRARPLVTTRMRVRKTLRQAVPVAAVLALGVLVGTLLPPLGPARPDPSAAPPSSPVTSPPVATEATRILEITRDLREELSSAVGWRRDDEGHVLTGEHPADGAGSSAFLDEDPRLWGAILSGLPAMGRFQDWLVAGGRPDLLPREAQRALEKCNEDFAHQDLPAPFQVYLDATPREEWIDPPPLLPGQEDFVFSPEPARGWRSLSRLNMVSMMAVQEALTEGAKRGEFPRTSLVKSMEWLGNMDLIAYLNVQVQFPGGRVTMGHWLEELTQATHALLYTVGRSIREEPETAQEVLAEGGDLFGFLRPPFYSRLIHLPLPLLLGIEPRTPLEFHLASRCEWTRMDVLPYYHPEDLDHRQQRLELVLELLARACETQPPLPGTEPGPGGSGASPEEHYRQADAWSHRIGLLSLEGRKEEAWAALAEWKRSYPERTPASRLHFGQGLLGLWTDRRGTWVLPEGTLEWCVDEVLAHAGDTPLWASTREAMRRLAKTGTGSPGRSSAP